MTAPTSTRGYVDPYRLGNDSYASLYLDVLEHVPDLTFPLSIPVYSKMRRDPKLSSIQQGWILNLLRAQWQLDPAGCRPPVVAAVADGLGLPIKGRDETPGPARLRGVSWGDHLRSVFRMVPFGFSAFELEADVSDGTARLAGLWERPQWTISHIHTDGKTGLLTGATQDGLANLHTPQMPANNLAWYAREREGSNWAGTSLLRPSYASWLIKEEVRRAFAVANVRWSAGVPVLEALPGTNPTQAQMGEAAEVAQAARAGISAGAATPPGFVMKILGITGSLPPTQEFLRWLDQQCAASALMNAFELGETPHGSRATASVFVDALLLALEAEAEFVADVATRQIAARIVDWNWGEDEPVPRIVVSGVGSRREVTAEALQMLLASGGLAADPALEAWIRREWRLPEREGMAKPKATAPGVDLPKDDNPELESDVGKVAAAARPRSPRRRKQNQPSLFGDDEDAAARIQQQWDAVKARLLRRWPKLAAPMVAELADQARAAVDVGDLALLGQLQVSAGVVAALAVPLRKSGTDLAADAAAGVVAEAAAQGTDITAPDQPGADRVVQHADAVARIIAAGYASGAARTGLQLAGVGPQEVRDEVERHLTELGTSVNGLVGDNIGSLLSAGQFAGRLAVLEEHPARSYRSNETLDRATCSPCREVSKQSYVTLRDALVDYPGGGSFRACDGRGRCRGFVQPVW
ncbi:hypothetical protein AMIS_20930 [Actinoplanes missouriensis 431]|uniref:Uncharacterized protein n=1 Tax=Actinoplanes missouriensis (strain ATCC 14538 / DSM 43046 / CBS 188.64 / JCM 3121 / NBRC 102363 / NCIMB 12654 / NRRL B-3342 / UNCC 431) TaxID=512565 RepID=I0H2S6_ACTM4|nr:DUF935 family protein [Actinoplanes missouriensis]BAL87313.1 hypothetical protein AMIS_20930 [Actinoplanes missouriensis 431]